MESTVIYVDILFAVNFITDGVCLGITGLMMGKRFVKWRFVCGCLLGGLYSVFALPVGEMLPVLAVILHFSSAILICFVTFPTKTFKDTLCNTVCFFAACALLGGGLCGIYSICGKFAVYRGAFYAELSPTALIASAVLMGTATVFCIAKAKGRASARHGEIKITFRGKSCDLFCLADSGNLMRCPYTALPVVSVSSESLQSLFDNKELESLKDTPAGNGIRPLPARGIGGSTVLPSFIPDEALVRPFGRREYKECRLCIAIDFGSCSYGGCDGAAPASIF